MIELTEEYKAAAREFRKTFGYSVPLSMIPPVLDTSEVIRAIRECVDAKEDRLLERFGVVLNEGDLF